MITNTTAKMTYTFTEGVTEYAVGFVYQTNPDGSPQIKVYINDAVNTPLVYGTDYTMSLDGTKVVIASGAEVGDSLTIIRNIPIVQLSDYVVGRIDPEQIENDFDLCVERDQQQSARITVTEEQLASHDERISDIEEVVPDNASADNLLATVSDIIAVQSDWNQSDNTKVDYIKNKPTLGTMAAESASDYTPTASLATVATTGDYDDLLDKPTIPAAQIQSDWGQSDNTKKDYIKNKPSIPTVNNSTITFTQGGTTKGSITLNQASAATIAFDAGGGAVDSVNGYTGAVVLTASDVGALPDSTIIPAAQIQSDWNQSDNTKKDYIKNKPSIPTVNNSTITFTQGGVSKGSITLNQSSAETIALDAGDYTGLLSAMYPVGSLYIGTQSTCPMSTLMSGTTWTLVSSGKALWTGNGSNGNTTIAAGLPNITGKFWNGGREAGAEGAFYTTDASTNQNRDYSGNQGAKTFNFDASLSSSIYGASATVQPPAYVVNVWRRTA